MISKHTPGPWVWNSMRTKLVGPNNEVVLQDGEGMWDLLATADNRQAEVNASLVATAPELLEELQQMVRAYVRLLEAGRDRIRDLGGECDGIDKMEADDPNLRAAKAVIAKATGGGK